MSSTSKKRKSSKKPAAGWEALPSSIRIDAEAKEKWDAIPPSDANIAFKQSVPILANSKRSPEDIYAIGETLIDSFDPTKLDLTRADTSAMPDQIARYSQRIACNQPPNLRCITLQSLHRMLQNESTEPREDTKVIDPKCFIPLLWFTEKLHELPYLPKLKEMFMDQLKFMASNTKADAAAVVWNHASEVYVALKQDLADYMFAATQLQQQAEERVKRTKASN